MQSLEIANLFISRHGNAIRLTNLSLNKLVYFAQAESLRTYMTPLFEDEIEAWEYGPVEPIVYRAFKGHGRARIMAPSPIAETASSPRAIEMVDAVVAKYGKLTAFDLVEFSHRDGGAWKACYRPDMDVTISIADILDSTDGIQRVDMRRTMAAGAQNTWANFPNAMRMLEDA